MALGPNFRMARNPRRRIFKEFKNGSMSALAEISGQSFIPAISGQREIWRGWD